MEEDKQALKQEGDNKPNNINQVSESNVNEDNVKKPKAECKCTCRLCGGKIEVTCTCILIVHCI